LFEQPEIASPERLPRRNLRAAMLVLRFVALMAVGLMAPRRTWAFLAVPIGLLLVFGPVIIGQRLGRRKS
jgi:hypothetical protein